MRRLIFTIVLAFVPTMSFAEKAQISTETMADGSRYEGEFRNGKRHGRGILITADGHRYEGEFLNGLRSGRGILRHTGYTYEGSFLNDKPHGQGVIIWRDGDRYEGGWADGKTHGFGTYTKADGRVFVGQWLNGCFSEGARWAVIGTT